MKSKTFLPVLITLLFAVFESQAAFGAKTVKIKITGSIYENVTVSVGQTGRTEIISSLPYVLVVAKDELPIKLHFQSDSYLYYDIDVPKKPFDTTGHVYLMKINEMAMATRNSSAPSPAPAPAPMISQSPSPAQKAGIDLNHGVNAAPATTIKNEKTFALIIANENYEMAANVDNATNDGLAFKEYCLKTLGIPAENIRYNTDLSFGRMKKAFSDVLDLASILNGDANLMLYYAGHGIPDNKTKDAFLLPVDADGTDTDVCVSLGDLYKKIDASNINRCVVFIDACFSGAQRGGDMIVAARGARLKPKEIVPEGKTIVFSATSDDEAAYSHKAEAHGLFTYFLLSKLQQTKGKVSLGELADYIREKVALESRRINNNAQTPRVSVSPALAESWKSMKLHQ